MYAEVEAHLMITVQLAAVFFSLFMMYVARIHRRKHNLDMVEYLSWSLVWFGFLVIAVFPDSVRGLMQSLSIGRVFDFIVIIALCLISYLVFQSQVVQRQLQRKLTQLTQAIALERVQTPLVVESSEVSVLARQRILVTGSHGFLGKHLVTELQKEVAADQLFLPTSKEYDLRNPEACRAACEGIDTVIHLAANVGGIGYNQQNPATLFYDNLVMGTHLMHEAHESGVKKFVSIGTICAYPKHTPIPFQEESLWDGYPEETNAPYGLAKKMQLVQAQAYREQYGWNAIYLLPVNLYGPGDNFNPDSSHVIPALIRKFVEAKKAGDAEVVVWGSGMPTREFLYVEDAAAGIVLATKNYNKSEPVNLGSSFEISIKDLATTIAEVVGYTGNITFDISKPDGQPRRKLDVSKAQREFGFTSKTSFTNGLKKTVEWYQKSQS